MRHALSGCALNMGVALKKHLLTFAVVAGLFPPAPLFANDSDEQCSGIARIAELVMKRRQDGTSLQSTLDTLDKVSEGARPALKRMIIAAYEVPVYSATENKDRAIGDFRDNQHVACLKVFQN